MDDLRKEIFFQERYLNTDQEYTIGELSKMAQAYADDFPILYKKLPFELSLSSWKVKAYTEYGSYGDSDGAAFRVIFYRWEDDNEVKIRLAKEELQKEKNEKKSIAAKKIAAEKKEAKKKLLQDPEYIKYLELQSKFK